MAGMLQDESSGLVFTYEHLCGFFHRLVSNGHICVQASETTQDKRSYDTCQTQLE
jgi:hypothetical protein